MVQLGHARAIVSRPCTQNRAWRSRRAKLIGKTRLIVLAPVAEAEQLAHARREGELKAANPALAPERQDQEWLFYVASEAKELEPASPGSAAFKIAPGACKAGKGREGARDSSSLNDSRSTVVRGNASPGERLARGGSPPLMAGNSFCHGRTGVSGSAATSPVARVSGATRAVR